MSHRAVGQEAVKRGPNTLISRDIYRAFWIINLDHWSAKLLHLESGIKNKYLKICYKVDL